jgi:hypothetical protein
MELNDSLIYEKQQNELDQINKQIMKLIQHSAMNSNRYDYDPDYNNKCIDELMTHSMNVKKHILNCVLMLCCPSVRNGKNANCKKIDSETV